MAKVTLDKNGLAKSAGTITVYNFDALTGEFTCSSNEFLAQGVGLPANACITAPPVTEAGRVAIYQDGVWTAMADHRGKTVYSVADGSAVLINAPGDYPADTTLIKPATAWDKWDGTKWVKDAEAEHEAKLIAIEKEKSIRIAEANSACAAWQAQLLLGIITEDDKERLTAWMAYVQKIQRVDGLSTPYVTWPGRPV
nr:tail fiber assembly protein [uncultured Pantoea sp.]